jgi:hypothetical protein
MAGCFKIKFDMAIEAMNPISSMAFLNSEMKSL